ncbi:MAG: hypothetical protein ACUVXJ_08015 [Phycisphaerae bacterium]
MARGQREIGSRAIDESVRLQRFATCGQVIGMIIVIVFLAIVLAALFLKA